jgi:hypothetical protein
MELGWAPAFARKYLNNMAIYLLSLPPLRLLLMTMLLPSDPAAPTCVYPFASYAVGCDAFAYVIGTYATYPLCYVAGWLSGFQVMGLDLDLEQLLENQQQIQWGLGFITTLFLLPIRL